MTVNCTGLGVLSLLAISVQANGLKRKAENNNCGKGKCLPRSSKCECPYITIADMLHDPHILAKTKNYVLAKL